MNIAWQRRTLLLKTIAALVVLVTPPFLRAQGSADYAIQLSAAIQEDPLAVVLIWPESNAQKTNDYTVHRRAPGAASWGEPLAKSPAVVTLEDGRRSFVDLSVEAGRAYEYQVTTKLSIVTRTGENHQAYGYILAGSRVPLVESRGTLILVVEQSLITPLAAELTRLQNDLIGDGWRVVRQEVARTDAATEVKAKIKQIYDSDPRAVKAVFLLGRVPVPYSGNFQPFPPDGHAAPADDHRGAWPADVFYAEMDGEWTDRTESYHNGNSVRATNVPGDGKFDQSYLPSDVELQLGRVDLSSLPGELATRPFADEITLLKSYLDKDHDFRHGRIPIRRKALIADSPDTNSGRAYPASGYRSFAPMVGPGNITVVSTDISTPRDDRWLSRLKADTYLWVYGTGAGSNANISGLGYRPDYNNLFAVDLVEEGPKGVFHLLFGSWFGDWDQPDNLMRMTLLAKYGLACAWSGRPHLVFHAMSLGETLGACIRLNQNDDNSYQNQINTFRRGVHIALLGDPTLRLHPLASPTELKATSSEANVVLSWKPSATDVLGYHVYRSTSAGDNFTRVTEAPITETRFTDPGRGADGSVYMIRAIALEVTPAGSYYNASVGVFAKVDPTAN